MAGNILILFLTSGNNMADHWWTSYVQPRGIAGYHSNDTYKKVASSAFWLNLFYFVLTEIFGQILSHEKLVRAFLHPITIAKRLSHTWEKRFIQSEISCQNESAPSRCCWRLFNVCRVSTFLLQLSRKLALNHRQKSFKEGKYAVSIIDGKEFCQAR